MRGSGCGEQLWQLGMAEIYLPLLTDCSNTDTLEAAVGTIQNLTACIWQPAQEFREHVSQLLLTLTAADYWSVIESCLTL